MSLTLNKLSALLLIFVFFPLNLQAAFQCYQLLDTVILENETTLNPAQNLINQLESRRIRVQQLIQMTSPQTQRQSKKIFSQLQSIVIGFTQTGEISDKNMTKFLELSDQLEKLEARLFEVQQAQLIDPFDLKRYLYTAEPLKPGVKYTADLPGLGEIQVDFSKETADLFSKKGFHRDSFFPLIFNGIVSKKGSNGIKNLTGNNAKTVGEIEYQLLELKKLHAGGARVVLVLSSEGILYFYKYIDNHNRIERITKEGFLDSFLRSRGLNSF